MENKINDSDKNKLRKIFKRNVIQSEHHESNIKEMYKLLREACEEQFTEDNRATLDNFLSECFSRSKCTVRDIALKIWKEGDPRWIWYDEESVPRYMYSQITRNYVVDLLNKESNASDVKRKDEIIEFLSSKVEVLAYSHEEDMYLKPEKPISDYEVSYLKVWEGNNLQSELNKLKSGLKSIYNAITKSDDRIELSDEHKLNLIHLACKELKVDKFN